MYISIAIKAVIEAAAISWASFLLVGDFHFVRDI